MLHYGNIAYRCTLGSVIWLGIARICRYFGSGKYYTKEQCLAILCNQECNDRFIIYFTT